MGKQILEEKRYHVKYILPYSVWVNKKIGSNWYSIFLISY